MCKKIALYLQKDSFIAKRFRYICKNGIIFANAALISMT